MLLLCLAAAALLQVTCCKRQPDNFTVVAVASYSNQLQQLLLGDNGVLLGRVAGLLLEVAGYCSKECMEKQ